MSILIAVLDSAWRILYGLWVIYWAVIMIVKRGKPISPEWVRDRLLSLGFDLGDDQLTRRKRATTYMHNLQFSGLFYEGQAKPFLEDHITLQELRNIYRGKLIRTDGELDPYGYTYWGPRLFLTEKADKDRMQEFLWEQMRLSSEGRQNIGEKI